MRRGILAAFVVAGASAAPVRVLDTDFPDPSVVYTGSEYYAFGTTGNGVNAQVASSPDFNTWTLLDGTDALPGPFPSWVDSSPGIWAPDVLQLVSSIHSTKIFSFANVVLFF